MTTLSPAAQKLNPKHRKFADELNKDFDRVRAYLAAGYKVRKNETARSGASRLLAREDIQDYLQEIQQHRSDRLAVFGDSVVEELKRIGFSNITHFIDAGPKRIQIKDLNSLPPELTACISEVSQETTKQGSVIVRIKLYDKVAALRLLAKYAGVDLSPNELLSRIRSLGFDPKDNRQSVPATDEEDDDDDLLDDDELD